MEALKLSQWKRAVEEKLRENVYIEYWSDVKALLSELPYSNNANGVSLEIGDEIRIGRESEMASVEIERLRAIVKRLFPWRKGPFSLFGIDIDAEWRSNLKWDRICRFLPDLRGKSVLDIGCNNGYYLFRLAALNPESILGIDPNARYYFQFLLLNYYAALRNIRMEPAGIEEISLLEERFDLILFLGVIYHRRDPLESLRIIKRAMNSGGVLIIESITVPGDSDYVLRPVERYSKMRNVWNIPSEMCLIKWLKDSGFENVEIISTHRTETSEQRKTELAPFESLSDFLDPSDQTLTVEGYPAPVRTIIRCE